MSDETKEKIFFECFGRLEEIFNKEPERRLVVIDGLEFLIRRLNGKDVFDIEVARRIRKESGLNLNDLSERLNMGPAGYISIRSYEATGIKKHVNYGENQMRYLSWLRKKGYDPFGLAKLPEQR